MRLKVVSYVHVQARLWSGAPMVCISDTLCRRRWKIQCVRRYI